MVKYGTKLRRKACESGWYVCDSKRRVPKQALILLAVVKKVDGSVDTLTGEQLELSPDLLCVAVEDKKLNANLMNSLRENARKRR